MINNLLIIYPTLFINGLQKSSSICRQYQAGRGCRTPGIELKITLAKSDKMVCWNRMLFSGEEYRGLHLGGDVQQRKEWLQSSASQAEGSLQNLGRFAYPLRFLGYLLQCCGSAVGSSIQTQILQERCRSAEDETG